MDPESRLGRYSSLLGLVLAVAATAVSAVVAEETMLTAQRPGPVEEVLVTALRLRSESFPATVHQWAAAGEGGLIARERTVKHVHNALPITEHQAESLRDNTKLLGLPALVAE
jgi:hypothetical protein